jgi:hypothetical protein
MTTCFRRAGWLLILPLALAPAACSDAADDRAALRDHELERTLNLALQADSAPAIFQDTAVAMVEPEPEPGPAPAPQAEPERPRAERQPAPAPAPAPAPRREAPRSQEPSQEQPAPQPAPEPRIVTATAAIGTSLGLSLDQTLSTETNRVGDAFTATLQHAVTDAGGVVVIPAGATVRGRLTQVDKSGHVGATGIIKVAFETVTFGGNSHALDATVVRANPQRQSRSNLQEQATKVAAGAAAGAILGRVLGRDTRSTLRGAAVGAAAGTAIAMGTTDVDVVLPQGSEMVIRLDSPISVRRVN